MGALFRFDARRAPSTDDSTESFGLSEDPEEPASQRGQSGQQVRTNRDNIIPRAKVDPRARAIDRLPWEMLCNVSFHKSLPRFRVRTTKYTALSFLPRNLLEQFHRVANLYFIFIVLLNWVPAINAFGKEVAMIPVVFVLGVTALKDFFEDRRRLASDQRVNNSTCRVYVR